MNGYLNCEDLIDPVVTFANSPKAICSMSTSIRNRASKWALRFNSKE